MGWLGRNIYKYIEKPIVRRQVLRCLRKNKKYFLEATQKVAKMTQFQAADGPKLMSCQFGRVPVPGNIDHTFRCQQCICPGNGDCLLASICPLMKAIESSADEAILNEFRHGGEYYLEEFMAKQSDAFWVHFCIICSAEAASFTEENLEQDLLRIASEVAVARGRVVRGFR